MNTHDEPAAIAYGDTYCMLDVLRKPECYPHPVQRIEILETHISWVILAGAYAYKIKKPVNLGFLDFSSLAARHYYCAEELLLNRRLAPDLYLEVVPITGEFKAPHIGGSGRAIEYAVKMRQFEQTALLDAKLACGELGEDVVVALARKIAAFHATAPNALTTSAIDPAVGLLPPALENFRQISPLLQCAEDVDALAKLHAWTLAEHHRFARLLAKRLNDGRIRECHGDLHLGNIVLLNGDPTPFDCIEFNPALRWIDTMSEVAFPVMDFAARGHNDYAHLFLNAYLEASGDYGGVQLLPFYLVYRALVRAKINLLRAAQPSVTVEARDRDIALSRKHISLADSYTQPGNGAVIITHGLSGSGKTTLTQSLIPRFGALRVRSDIERKRLHGLAEQVRSNSAVGVGIYAEEATASLYALLLAHARNIASAGFPALIDATFLNRTHRQMFRELALELSVPFRIISFNAPLDELRTRIAVRAAQGTDASEATLEVLDGQIATLDPLRADERENLISINGPQDIESATKQLSQILR